MYVPLPLDRTDRGGWLKEQYVGDINDYRKYALLRALADGGRHRIGIGWMLTPSDDGRDGNKLTYLTQPERYRAFDPELFDLLGTVVGRDGGRRLIAIEQSGAIPNARYFNAETPQGRDEREAWLDKCLRALAGCDLVFLDPDNGLAVASTAKGRKNSPKYVFLDEVAAFYTAGQSVLIYQHYPRVERQTFEAACAATLSSIARGAQLWRFATGHVVFLLILHPGAPATLAAGIERAASRWPKTFIYGGRLIPGGSETELAAEIN